MNYTEMEAKVREATNNEPWVRTLSFPAAQFWWVRCQPVDTDSTTGRKFQHVTRNSQWHIQLVCPSSARRLPWLIML